MVKKITGLIDSAAAMLATAAFLSTVMVVLAVSAIAGRRKRNRGPVRQLYLSIVDVRETGIPTQKDDMLLAGLIENIFCYHFDFERPRDEISQFGEAIQLNIVSVHPDNMLGRLGLKRTVACLVEMKTFYRMLSTVLKKRVNVIRAQDPHLLGFNAYLLSRAVKVPFIVQICSNYEVKDRQAKGLTFRPFVFQEIERRFERAIMKASDLVLADREHYRSFGLIPEVIPHEKYGNMGFFVSDVHYAPPASRRDMRDQLKISPEKKILLYVGRLVAVKYTLDLIKIFSLCAGKRDDLALVIAGDGILKREMEEAAVKEGVRDSVIFLQKVPQKKLVDLYHTADLACFTSAGFTMVEAALAEKCIVTYDFEWHAEFIGRNERGVLVPFRDADGFAGEVLRMMEDRKLREEMGRAARTYALANYSRNTAIEKEIRFYKDMFDRAGYKLEKIV